MREARRVISIFIVSVSRTYLFTRLTFVFGMHRGSLHRPLVGSRAIHALRRPTGPRGKNKGDAKRVRANQKKNCLKRIAVR